MIDYNLFPTNTWKTQKDAKGLDRIIAAFTAATPDRPS